MIALMWLKYLWNMNHKNIQLKNEIKDHSNIKNLMKIQN